MARAVLAVVAGFLVWSMLWLGLGALLPAVSRASFDEQGLPTHAGILLAFLIGSVACSLASGWLAAWIAPHKAFGAALALGILLLAVGIAVQASVWNAMPVWYHVSFLGLLVPATIGGAMLWPRSAGAPAASLAAVR